MGPPGKCECDAKEKGSSGEPPKPAITEKEVEQICKALLKGKTN